MRGARESIIFLLRILDSLSQHREKEKEKGRERYMIPDDVLFRDREMNAKVDLSERYVELCAIFFNLTFQPSSKNIHLTTVFN